MKNFLRWYERFEYSNSNIFWLLAFCLALVYTSIQHQIIEYLEYYHAVPQESIRLEILIRGGKGNIPRESFNSLTGLKKRKKFSIVFHCRLEQHFPDWNERMAYQKNQENFYKSALRKQRELKKLNIREKLNYYTREELDALDYFQGTGFYQKYQDPRLKPNIFDTRQTFLFKMHEPLLRKNFLNSLNHQND